MNENPRLAHGNSLPFRYSANTSLHEQQFPATQITSESRTINDGKHIFEAIPSQGSTASSYNGNSNINNLTPAASELPSKASDFLSSTSYSLIGPSFEEAEQYLTEFRTQKLIDFAFIHLSASTAIQQLQQERPFLFLAIMAVSAKSGSQRLALGHEFKTLLSRELVFSSEGNFDLLLGLLVFIAW